jgi:hypothetical protein
VVGVLLDSDKVDPNSEWEYSSNDDDTVGIYGNDRVAAQIKLS